jgi:hypothetical protein
VLRGLAETLRGLKRNMGTDERNIRTVKTRRRVHRGSVYLGQSGNWA